MIIPAPNEMIFLNMNSDDMDNNETCKTVVTRKNSLPLTPEDEPLDIFYDSNDNGDVHDNSSSVDMGPALQKIEINHLDCKCMEAKNSSLGHSILKAKKGLHDIRHDHLKPPIRSPLLVLVVYSQYDSSAESLTRAAEKLGYEVTFCDSYDGALEEFQVKNHDLIFIDTRTMKLEYDTLCRSIRNTKGSQHVATVAVVKKGIFEKDEVTVSSLLESGFNRCIVESSNTTTWYNELIQLTQSDVRPMAQYATTKALFVALDKCKDVVLVTDDSCRMQYINSAGENTLGFRYEELLGKAIQDQLATDVNQIMTMCSRLGKGRSWNGQLHLKKKGSDSIPLFCQGMPVVCAGRYPTHYVIVMDNTGNLPEQRQSRGSIHSIRKGSLDVRSLGSDLNRRTSMARLSALPLEAPITKVINLIAQAQDAAGTNTSIITSLDKAIDLLRCTELYSPQMRVDQAMKSGEEPVTADLIGALLSNSQPLSYTSRRSSNDSSIYRKTSNILSKIKVPSQIKELLDNSLSWDFDVIRLEELTNKRPLVNLGINLFAHFDVAQTLNVDEKILYNFLILVESKYHCDNTYHNSTHAADVMQAVAGYMEKEKLMSLMDPLDQATSLLAAACHDIDHPGRSSTFLCNSESPLAILYNDVTVLENHHAALTFRLALGDDRVNIFKNLEKDTYKVARQNIIDMILATEMTKHFEHLTKFINVFSKSGTSLDCDDTRDELYITDPENMVLIKRMMIKCADVSNPTRPLALCVEWSRRITEEYFQQTDEEKAKGLPVLMPMFDRYTCSIPKAQIGFVDFIINDMVEAWNSFLDFPELVTYMRQNYLKWKEFDEQGYSTLSDIKKMQVTMLSSKATHKVSE